MIQEIINIGKKIHKAKEGDIVVTIQVKSIGKNLIVEAEVGAEAIVRGAKTTKKKIDFIKKKNMIQNILIIERTET
jgi:archaellum component FlaG (FlaF/FlaG flagellin family)